MDAASIDKFEELHRRVRLTTGARFKAARRLARHDKFAQWTIALLSVALVVVPLLQALSVTTGLSMAQLNVLQIVLAVLVLVFSLLLSRDNFSVRADKMHRCGLELGQLERDIFGFVGTHRDEASYKEFSDRYYGILQQYENHEDVDYEMYKLWRKDEHYKDHNLMYVRHWARTQIRYWLAFMPYFVLFAIVGSAFWMMLHHK